MERGVPAITNYRQKRRWSRTSEINIAYRPRHNHFCRGHRPFRNASWGWSQHSRPVRANHRDHRSRWFEPDVSMTVYFRLKSISFSITTSSFGLPKRNCCSRNYPRATASLFFDATSLACKDSPRSDLLNDLRPHPYRLFLLAFTFIMFHCFPFPCHIQVFLFAIPLTSAFILNTWDDTDWTGCLRWNVDYVG